MATWEQIRHSFYELAGNFGPAPTNIAKVKSIDEQNGTCVLIDEDDQEFLEVRLKPVLSENKSFIQIPKVGSYVLAIRVENDDDWMVIACDEVEKFLWTVGNTKLELTDKICIEAGNQSLKDLMERLFTVIERGYQTNSGVTIKLVLDAEFTNIKTDFKKLLK